MGEPLDIMIAVPGMPISPDVLTTKSLGGSETAGVSMAKALGRQGHRVTVFGNVPGPMMEDHVNYLPQAGMATYLQNVPHDVAIVQRMPEAFVQPTGARLNILWQHDLALVRTGNVFRGCLWNIDKVFLLSQFHKQQYQQVYDPTDDIYHVTRNGIDLGLFPKGGTERSRNVLMYGARPERGIDVLLDHILPRVWAQRPDVVLWLATYEHSHPSMQEFYAEIDAKIGRLRTEGHTIEFVGHLPKPQLYQKYREATLYVYPTPSPFMKAFAEISCISAMECMAAGLPFVGSKRGALPETLHPDAGVLIDGDPWTEGYQDAMAREIVALLNDRERRRKMSIAGATAALGLSWDRVAEEWTEKFHEWIAQHNTRLDRLARHCIWLSDIVPAREVIKRLPAGEEKTRLTTMIDEGDWDFVGKGSYKDQYEKPKHDLEVFDVVQYEQRLGWLIGELMEMPDAEKVLDVGVAHGAYPIWANKRLAERGKGPRWWVGTDISEHSIECAHTFLNQGKSPHPERHLFLVGDSTLDLAAAVPKEIERRFGSLDVPTIVPREEVEGRANGFAPPYDVLILFEVLEHVPEPWTFLNHLEKWLHPGTQVLITVPSGPWEAMSYETYPHRFHIWHYDLHDLREMLGHKPDFAAAYTPHSRSDRDSGAVGWWFVKYKVGNEPVKPIDMERHLALQRPRETISLVCIAGKTTEDTMPWTLNSVAHLMDEIIVVDNGMTPAARQILEQRYKAVIVPGVNPLEHGFETPRNLGVQRATMDWIMWLDLDEKILGAQHLYKYLRRNSFEGYGIQQHHFAVDTKFRPDLPVRIFRNNGRRNDDKAIRFWGMIHEHPEIAINEGPGRTVILADMHIAHVGYLSEDIRRRRFQRNNPLLVRDREKYPHRMLGHHFEIRDNLLMAKFILERNGGRMIAEVRHLCEEIKRLYRLHFLGKPFYLQADTLGYYSEALALLNEGFEFTWTGAASKDGATAAGEQRKARFATVDELNKTLAVEYAALAQQFTSPYW